MKENNSPVSNTAQTPNRRWIFLGLISLFLMYFLYLGGWAFLDADEGRYGNVAREMLVNGDWITPTQNHIKFFDKPPLLYWGMAASYALFGLKEWAARLIPTLAALSGVLMAWVLGRRMFGARAGLLSATILSTTLMWPVMARVVVTDMLVSSLVFTALALWWMGHSELDSKQKTRWFLGFWSTLALAVLAKGPVTLVLIGGSIFGYLLFCRKWRALREMRWAMGIPLCLLVAAPWFIVVAIRNPEFNYYFWYDQHIARFLGKSISGADHIEGRDYYLKLLPIILFPWSLFVLTAIPAAITNFKKPDSPRRRAGVFLMSGVLFILLFFSSTSSKLITYLLPIIPLTAILLAAHFDRLLLASKIARRAFWSSAGVLGALIIAGGVAAFLKAPGAVAEFGVDATGVQIVAALLAVWGLAILVFVFQKRQNAVVLANAGGFAIVFVALLPVIAGVMPHLTTQNLVEKIRSGLTAQSQIITFPYTQSVSFYANRRVIIIGQPSEIQFGLDHLPREEHEKWVFDGDKNSQLQALKTKLALGVPVYCFLRPSRDKPQKTKELLHSLEKQAGIVAFNDRFVVIGNNAALKLTPEVSTPAAFADANSLVAR